MPTRLVAVLLVALLAALAGACTVGDDEGDTRIEGLGSSLAEIQRLARGEGALNLVALPGNADESWAGVFERQTGCRIAATEVETADAMLGRLGQGGWDGVSAPGSVSGRLLRGGDVAPLDTDLVPNLEVLVPGLQDRPHASRDDRTYGVPIGRAPTFLLFRTDALPEDTASWGALWEAPRSFAGRLALLDEPIVIADAALYLKTARPDLAIDDPYALDQRQLRAAVRLVRRQAGKVGEFWTRAASRQVERYSNGDTVVGMAWPRDVEGLEESGAPVRSLKPVEGTTGWSDTWMVNANAANPNCMYLWMDYVLSPEAQAKIAERLMLAPANLSACALTVREDHCERLHADDEEWWTDVRLWQTPATDCGDDRGEVCTSYEEWAAAWASTRPRR